MQGEEGVFELRGLDRVVAADAAAVRAKRVLQARDAVRELAGFGDRGWIERSRLAQGEARRRGAAEVEADLAGVVFDRDDPGAFVDAAAVAGPQDDLVSGEGGGAREPHVAGAAGAAVEQQSLGFAGLAPIGQIEIGRDPQGGIAADVRVEFAVEAAARDLDDARVGFVDGRGELAVDGERLEDLDLEFLDSLEGIGRKAGGARGFDVVRRAE